MKLINDKISLILAKTFVEIHVLEENWDIRVGVELQILVIAIKLFFYLLYFSRCYQFFFYLLYECYMLWFSLYY